MELISRLQDKMVNHEDVAQMKRIIKDFNSKIRHISVFAQSLALNLIFEKETDMTNGIRDRKQLAH